MQTDRHIDRQTQTRRQTRQTHRQTDTDPQIHTQAQSHTHTHTHTYTRTHTHTPKQRGVAAGWRTVECPNGECVGVGYVEMQLGVARWLETAPTVQCWLCNHTFLDPTRNDVRWPRVTMAVLACAIVAACGWGFRLLLFIAGLTYYLHLGQAVLQAVQKPCPGCGVLIEKNAGCDHMTCRCGHHFYWTTLRPYP
jgi:hypothetical protein